MLFVDGKDRNWATACQTVPVGKGTAVVFDNMTVAHRFRRLKNISNDGSTQNRSFLAFFIVDPKKPIKSTRDIPSLKREYFADFISTVRNDVTLDLSTSKVNCPI